MSLIYSRMAAFSATLLIFCGEALTGVAIDAAAEGRLDGAEARGDGDPSSLASRSTP